MLSIQIRFTKRYRKEWISSKLVSILEFVNVFIKKQRYFYKGVEVCVNQ